MNIKYEDRQKNCLKKKYKQKIAKGKLQLQKEKHFFFDYILLDYLSEVSYRNQRQNI